MKAILIPFSLVLALGLAGCGGGGGGDSFTPVTPLTVAPQGTLGGQNLGITVTATGATVTLPCSATGIISHPLTLDSTGHFDQPGTIKPTGTSPTTITADYAGTVTRNTNSTTMHITITTSGSGVIGSSQSYDLTYNVAPTFTSTCGS